MRLLVVVSVLLACLCGGLVAQTPVSGVQVIEKTSPSVALVVASVLGEEPKYGTAVIVRPDGVLLTAYHVVHGARAVQVRLKSGEVYDQVQLLAADERRDIAALRIPASALPAISVAELAKARPGAKAYVIGHPLALPWSASEGVVSAVRMADEVPGAGQGYRIIQFTAPASPGSSGGVLLDEQGGAWGIVVAQLPAGQNVNFPFQSRV